MENAKTTTVKLVECAVVFGYSLTVMNFLKYFFFGNPPFLCLLGVGRNEVWMNYIALVFFTLLVGRGMAATNCGSIPSKCSFTMHIRFCTRSLLGANDKPSQLNLAWIDSAPCSPRRKKVMNS